VDRALGGAMLIKSRLRRHYCHRATERPIHHDAYGVAATLPLLSSGGGARDPPLLLVATEVIPDIGTMATDERDIPDDPTPLHERTADEEAGVIDWEGLAASERFRQLLKAKRRFIVPATIFFVVYYFALPVLIGYARPLMAKPVLGPLNWAYLFALSQFFVAWIIAALYVRAAARFDKMAAAVIEPGTPGR
jgi:uncharacterized membrane protein (DUF485 family)